MKNYTFDWNEIKGSLHMEQNKKGRMGGSTKPDNGNNNYIGAIKKTRV